MNGPPGVGRQMVPFAELRLDSMLDCTLACCHYATATMFDLPAATRALLETIVEDTAHFNPAEQLLAHNVSQPANGLGAHAGGKMD